MFVFFFNDTATTEIYTLSLHDALPICREIIRLGLVITLLGRRAFVGVLSYHLADHDGNPSYSCDSSRSVQIARMFSFVARSEEHTSELQSQAYLVCRLLLEKKKNIKKRKTSLYKHTKT